MYPWQPSQDQLKSLLRSFVSPEEVIKGGKSEEEQVQRMSLALPTLVLSQPNL